LYVSRTPNLRHSFAVVQGREEKKRRREEKEQEVVCIRPRQELGEVIESPCSQDPTRLLISAKGSPCRVLLFAAAQNASCQLELI
jgi:hypothetical protein